ncbi:MAG: hypothetical protein R3Y22_07075 [Bacteroidales bacterium]
MKRFLYVIIVFSMCGCVSNTTHEELKSQFNILEVENKKLLEEIDDLKNGENRLIDLIKNSYFQKKYIKTSEYIETLKKRHPESSYIRTINKEYPALSSQVQEELASIEKIRKDSIRLANIDNLGIWKVGYYVDDFGEPTKEVYITCDIYGTFSNSATTNSDLRVRFLIDNNSMRIQLYEYARNHPIKGEGTIKFRVLDSNGKTHSFTTYNGKTGDNTVSAPYFKVVKGILLDGGKITFIAVADDGYGTPSEYKFTVQNADFFENAIYKMDLSAKK